MIHLVKINLSQFSDLFISKITNTEITWTRRDPDGKLLEPEQTTKFELVPGQVIFGHAGAFVTEQQFRYAKQILS